MIRLKSILSESQVQDEYKNHILELLNQYDINYENMIYRGSKSYNISEISYIQHRADRLPLSTVPVVDSIVEIYRSKFYPNLPSRRSTLFCTQSRDMASVFGQTFIVIPLDIENIYYSDEDTYTYTGSITLEDWNRVGGRFRATANNTFGQYIKEHMPIFYEFCMKNYDTEVAIHGEYARVKEVVKSADEFLDKNMMEMFNEIHDNNEFIKENITNNRLAEALYNFDKRTIKVLDGYFGSIIKVDLRKDKIKFKKEVMIWKSNIYVISNILFKSFYKRTSDGWKLND